MLTESDSFVVDVVLLFFSIDFVQREVNIIVSFCVFKTWGGGGVDTKSNSKDISGDSILSFPTKY